LRFRKRHHQDTAGLEALSGLRAFGKAATEETVQKIQSVVIDSELTNKKVFSK
jgi:hypothetical protein